jgi:hypothetical protein
MHDVPANLIEKLPYPDVRISFLAFIVLRRVRVAEEKIRSLSRGEPRNGHATPLSVGGGITDIG